MTSTIQLPTGHKNREALVLAAHGPLAAVKATKVQQKSLVKQGYLTEQLELTDKGQAAYSEMARPLDWSEFLRLEWVFSDRIYGIGGRNPSGYVTTTYVTALSADGRTAYVCNHGTAHEAAAIAVATIPDTFRPAFGLSERRLESVDTEPRKFEAWYKLVDREVIAIAGIGIDDLADGPSWDAWADGYTPAEYAHERLEKEGFPF